MGQLMTLIANIFRAILGKQEPSLISNNTGENMERSAREIITLEEYLTSSGAYPERAKSPELTEEFLTNARKLLVNVNPFLYELGIFKVKVSSGFRPSYVNERVKNAAKRSLHMQCLAVDILDDANQTIATTCAANPDLMRKYNLFLESPAHTKGKNTNWIHLQYNSLKDRPSRIFIP